MLMKNNVLILILKENSKYFSILNNMVKMTLES
jgi:hypothetical protein